MGLFYCLLIFSIVTALATLIQQNKCSFGSILIPALWGFGAVLPLYEEEGNQLAFGFTLPRFTGSLRYFLLSSLVVFPLYVLGYRLCVHWGFSMPVSTSFGQVSIPHWVLYNFLAVALFEELFFRGFVQGRFEVFAKNRFPGSSSRFWIPVLVSSLLFALAHMAVYLDPLRLVVFFPGLLFGWLRAKTGFLLAPILSHGTANLVSMLFTSSVL